MTSAAAGPERREDAPYPKESYAWFVIGVLFLVTLFSQLDRQLPTLLVAPIRAAFGISDTGFSFLQGYAFALVYTLAGLPFGRLVDRANRRNLIAAGLVIWSLMTMLCGFAETYWQLFAARMGVGVGEAVLAPAAYSIIADYVAPHRRGRALGFYYVSLAIGSGASLLIGGVLLGILPDAGLVVPGFGLMAPWKLMFLFAGAPGLLLTFLVFAVREPVRRDLGAARAGAEVSIREFLAYLRRHGRTFSRVLVYPAVLAVIGYGSLSWAPVFLVRKFGLEPANAGMTIGLVVAVTGLVGTLGAAFLSDRWVARKVPAARLRVTLVAWAVIVPSVLVWPLVPDLGLSIAFLVLANLGAAIGTSSAPAILADVAPNRMRGQTVAVYLLIAGLAGIGFGPTAVALVTDQVFHGDAALPYSLVIVCFPMALVGAWLCLSGLKPYAETTAKLAAGNAG